MLFHPSVSLFTLDYNNMDNEIRRYTKSFIPDIKYRRKDLKNLSKLSVGCLRSLQALRLD